MSQTWKSRVAQYECITSHVSTRNVTHVNESFRTWNICQNESCLIYRWVKSEVCMSRVIQGQTVWVMSHTWMRHVTRMNESNRTYEWVTSHICIHLLSCMCSIYTHVIYMHILLCTCILCIYHIIYVYYIIWYIIWTNIYIYTLYNIHI